jgi:hypothetical protein
MKSNYVGLLIVVKYFDDIDVLTASGFDENGVFDDTGRIKDTNWFTAN